MFNEAVKEERGPEAREHERLMAEFRKLADSLDRATDQLGPDAWQDGDLFYALDQLGRATDCLVSCVALVLRRHFAAGNRSVPPRLEGPLLQPAVGGPI